MSLWLAVDKDLNSLGVEEAITAEQAFYQFMKYSLYPANVIELPDSVVSRTELDDAVDEAHFNSCGPTRGIYGEPQ